MLSQELLQKFNEQIGIEFESSNLYLQMSSWCGYNGLDGCATFLREHSHARPEQPWFLYLSYNAPHTPLQATDDDLAACSHIQDKGRRTYAAMIPSAMFD